MSSCPHCHAPNADDARFCGACGKATSSTEPTSNPSFGEPPRDIIGREVAGRYRILAKLGEGGMGTVYRAEQISLKRTIALKVLRPDVGGGVVMLRRFDAEAAVVAKLSHPNTVNIFDYGQDTDGLFFIAMEYIEGKSLRSVIHADAPLPLRRALSIAAQVAASISDAHAHAIIHRDLKPDNVMLQERGRTKDVVRVLDFGIAKLRDDSRANNAMTQAGDMLGTPQYMAPEQIRAEAIDGRTDVYALGCMLYEMVTARLPFEAPTVMALLSKHLMETPLVPSQRRPELGLPAVIDELIMGAMAKAPAQRPATMEQLGEHITALLATLPADAPGPSGNVGVPYVAPTLAPSAVIPVAHAAETPAALSAYAPPTPPPSGPAAFAPPGPPPSAPAAYPPPPSASFTPPPAPYTPTPPPPQYPPPAATYNPPAPAPAPPPPSPTPAPPTFQIAAPPSGNTRTILIIIGLLVLGGAGVGAYILTRDDSKRAVTVDPPADPPKDDWDTDPPPDPDDDKPDPDDPDVDKPDPWGAPSSSSSSHGTLPGETIDVGQGARFIMPPGFVQQANDSAVVAMDLSRGIVFVFSPIDADTDDANVLAKRYAAGMNLPVKLVSSRVIQGAERKFALFEGSVDGIPVRHLVIAYLSASYRIGLIVHVPQAIGNDPSVQALVSEAAERRLLLP